MIVDLKNEDAQIVVLALAQLALDRPGWDHMIGLIAKEFHGEQTFQTFKWISADRFKLLPMLDSSPRE